MVADNSRCGSFHKWGSPVLESLCFWSPYWGPLNFWKLACGSSCLQQHVGRRDLCEGPLEFGGHGFSQDSAALLTSTPEGIYDITCQQYLYWNDPYLNVIALCALSAGMFNGFCFGVQVVSANFPTACQATLCPPLAGPV